MMRISRALRYRLRLETACALGAVTRRLFWITGRVNGWACGVQALADKLWKGATR